MKRKFSFLIIFIFIVSLIFCSFSFAKYIDISNLKFGNVNVLQEFNVSFDPMVIGQLKSSDEQRKVIKGNAVGTLPTPLVKEGYSFDGWYENLLNLQEMPKTGNDCKDISISNEELTLTATNGGKTHDTFVGVAYIPTQTSETYYNSDPAKYGQITEIDATKDLSFVITNSAFNKNYFTFWDKDYKIIKFNDGNYYKHFGSNSGTVKSSEIPSNAKYVTFRLGIQPSVEGQTYTTKVIIKRGGIPKTWVSYNKQLQPTDIITSDTEYFARYNKNTYTISYNLNGGAVSTSNETEYQVDTPDITLNAPTKTGYTFTGYKTEIKPTSWTTGWLDLTTGTVYSSYLERFPDSNDTRTSIYSEPILLKKGVTYDMNGLETATDTLRYRGYDTNGNYIADMFYENFKEFTPNQDMYVRVLIWGNNIQNKDKFSLTEKNLVKTPVIYKGSTGNRSYTANWKGTDAMVLSGSDFKNKLISIQKIANNNNDLNSNLMQTISWSNTKPDSKYLKDDYSITVNNDEYPTRIYLYPGETKKTLYFRDSESFGFKKTEIISKDEYDEKDTDNYGFTTYSNYRKLDIYVNYYMYSSSSNLYLNPNSNFSFDDCSGLTSLDLSKFNTSKVTDMDCMFGGCSGLTSLNLSNFNTSNVTDMSFMFCGCSGLTSLNLSNFNTSNVTDMRFMFDGCSGLTSLNLSNFNTSNVTDMTKMFNDCSGLTSLNLSNFNTSNVTDMSFMFNDCSGLTILDLSSFNTSKVTNMTEMFSTNSYSLTPQKIKTIYVSNLWSTSAVTSSDKMFYNCSNLKGGSGTIYNGNYIDKTYARIDGGTSKPGYFTYKASK